ncbi:uncharacterized protein CGFF_05130 [Nakaseomyces glabratus]|nr:hypothetical protein J6894_04854 [Nakaseomyces glabratus]QNG16919.1 uncharacterized protein GWK60_M04785 [Nakaseomyces glabratus]SCV17565.1 uncharacterized protein CGFF_05130 [Nakaseomyces glabratus]SLM17324.1 uncharacterized protein CGFF_05130 [Nakaseomyces glabratus]
MGLRKKKTLVLEYKRNSCTALSQSTYCTAGFHTNSQNYDNFSENYRRVQHYKILVLHYFCKQR